MFPETPGLTREAEEGELEFIGDSTCVQAARFKRGVLSTTGKLVIQFQDGTMYTYHNVHIFVWFNFKRALSKGFFFNRNVRNKYQFSEGDAA